MHGSPNSLGKVRSIPAAAANLISSHLMEVLTAAQPSSSVASPQWVLLEQHCKINKLDDENPSCCCTADASSLVTALTTTGKTIQAYLRLVDPPASSALCVQFPDDGRHHYASYTTIIAAHKDSLLIQVQIDGSLRTRGLLDHFVYNAGAGARPPSLSLLPPYYPTTIPLPKDYINRYLPPEATGILRRHGQVDEVVVAELKMVAAPEPERAELLLFRSGQWSVHRAQIRYGDRDFVELPSLWTTDTVADRLLCWVDLRCGVLFCDMFEESPWLKFVPLPVDPCYGQGSHRNVCVTVGGGALKFVNIFPRCCCGGDGETGCRRSMHAYTIKTWSMRMSDMDWVKDGMIDATELWGGDAYKSLPRVMPLYPVVSMDEPHTICFLLCHAFHDRDGDETLWLIMVDMKSKMLRLVIQYPGGFGEMPGLTLIPSSVSYYLNNASPSCSSNDGTTSAAQSGFESPQVLMVHEQLRDGDLNNSALMQSSCHSSAEPAMEVTEILASLQDLPSYGFDCDDLLKACRILSHGDGRRFRSLKSTTEFEERLVADDD